MEVRESMDARFSLHRIVLLTIVATLPILLGAQYETANFSVRNAPTAELAKEFCETAEQCRYDMAVLWLGRSLPDWSEKCPIVVHVGQLGAGGQTSFIFQGGEVYGWEMEIQGSARRILDSVLPHEITHMVFASHFRRPVPRWLDEGAATSVEHDEEKDNYRRLIRHYLRPEVKKCLPFRRMIAMKDYPSDVMPFYAQGFSVVEYLILLGGHQELVRFAEAGMKADDWDEALRTHYGFKDLGDLQKNYWIGWVAAGAPLNLPATLRPSTSIQAELSEPADTMIASARSERQQPDLNSITLVSAKPSRHYAKEYDSVVIPIPNRWDDSQRVVPIPSSFDAASESVIPALDSDKDSSDSPARLSKSSSENGIMLLDSSSTQAVYR